MKEIAMYTKEETIKRVLDWINNSYDPRYKKTKSMQSSDVLLITIATMWLISAIITISILITAAC